MFYLTLPIIAILLLVMDHVDRGRKSSDVKRYAISLGLLVCGVVGVASWWTTAERPARVHTWDLFHYYLGAKYFPELRYTGLYRCTLESLNTSLSPLLNAINDVRDLETNELKSAEQILRRGNSCLDQFTPERWADFSQDAHWFLEKLGPPAVDLFRDHGFNASPLWIRIARLIIPAGPVSDEVLTRLTRIDFYLLVATWSLFFLIMPVRVSAVCGIFWGLNPLGTFEWTGGAFLRQDYFVLFMLSFLAARVGKISLAGMFLGVSSVLRIFPICAAVGNLLSTVSKKSEQRTTLRFLVPLCLSLAFAVLLIGLLDGFGVWLEFYSNLTKHVSTRAGNLVGLQHVADNLVQCRLFGFGGEAGCFPPEHSSAGAFNNVAFYISAVVCVAFLVWLTRISSRVNQGEIMALSLCLLPLATNAACYYYEVFALVGVVTASFPLVGVGLLLLCELLQLLSLSGGVPNKFYLVASILVVQFVVIVPMLCCYWKPPRFSDKSASDMLGKNESPVDQRRSS